MRRYYAGDLTDYKLRAYYQSSLDYTRYNYDDGWGFDREFFYTSYIEKGKLKTPYSDEYNIAIQQKIANSLWTLKWVQRQSKDQLMTQYNNNSRPHQRWLVNQGQSTTNHFSLEISNIEPIQTDWLQVNWGLGASYQKTKKNNQTYDYTQNRDVQKVIIDNKLYAIDKMPALNFNSPWTAYARLSLYFPQFNLYWGQQLNYTSAHKNTSIFPVNCANGYRICENYRGLASYYQERKYPRNITLDWNIDWHINLPRQHKVSFNLTVLNVLNRVAKAERLSENFGLSYYQSYQPGRQFWLGMKYEW